MRAQRWGSGGDGDDLSLTLEHLTPRQCAILTRLGRGEPLKAIAADLGISYETAKTHCKRAYEKMGLSDPDRHVYAGIAAHARFHDALCDVTDG